MNKDNKQYKMWLGILLGFIVVVIVVVAIVMNAMNGKKTGDIEVSGSSKMVGLKCEEASLPHPVFADINPVSHTNSITANFANDRLSTIMYQYDGVYTSEEEAKHARVLAEADYNLILSNDYDQDIDIFSHNFMSDGNKLSLTITAKADKVSSRTAPYFLLDTTSSFPKTLESMKQAYEAKSFTCKVEDKDV